MITARTATIAATELRILRRDAAWAVFVVAPLALALLLKPLFGPVLQNDGFVGAGGAEQAIPGVFITGAYFIVGYFGLVFFREHGWGTWDRLRASAAKPLDILVGKSVSPVAMLIASFLLLFGFGGWLLDLHVAGSAAGAIAVALAFSVSVVALGVALVGVCKTFMQFNAASQGVALLLGAAGGAIVPLSVLPGWIGAIAPATPSYWAMRGFRDTILRTGTLGDVVLPVVVLLGFALACTVVAVARFRFDETKTAWF